MLNIIVAIARNRAIGFENKLLYSLPDDLRHFRQLTTGHTVVMGRRTFESLPKGALPKRRNIVLTRGRHHWSDTEVFPSLRQALAACPDEEQVFVIGGASVYKEALPLAKRLFVTEIDDEPAQADTFFPEFKEWKEVSREHHPADERHEVAFDFVVYRR